MPMPQPLRRQSDLVLSHMGFYVKNLEASSLRLALNTW